jgi:hypothetical protein
MAGKILILEGAAPATPASGYVAIYAKLDGTMYTKNDAGVETAIGSVTTILTGSLTAGDTSHAPTSDAVFKAFAAYGLQAMFDLSNVKPYVELTYASGSLTDIDSYVDSSKVTKLFNKHLTYDVSGNLTTVVTTRTSDSATLTKTFTYASGDLVSVQST